MHSTRLDHAQSVTTNILDAIYGGDSMDQLIEMFPSAKGAFKSMAEPDDPFFHPLLITFDDDDQASYTLISSAMDKDGFLAEAFTVLTVMDVKSFVMCIDAYIKLGAEDSEHLDMSLEQMHALEVDGVYPCLSILSFNLDEGLAGRYIPYEFIDTGIRILEDKAVHVNKDEFKEMDESFKIVFSGCNKILAIDIDERISEYWTEFINNEEASAIFFEGTDYDRAEALEAFEELKKIEDGKKYARYIIEDALLDASNLHIVSQPKDVVDTYATILNHIEEQTEIGQWLTKARLTS